MMYIFEKRGLSFFCVSLYNKFQIELIVTRLLDESLDQLKGCVIMMPTKSVYRQVYKQGVESGLSITNARQYYRNGEGTQPRLEQTLDTPWLFRGQPVIGFTDTNLKDEKADKDGLRLTDTREFYVADAMGRATNLDALLQPGEGLQDKQGKFVSIPQAQDIMGRFASAASEYPHVFLHDEYIESRSYLNGRFGMDPPTTADYNVYLDSVAKQLASRDFIFTGRITRPSQLHVAYESTPEFQSEYQDWSASLPETEQFGQ